jgi:alpha-N-acetylglucosamine transferase
MSRLHFPAALLFICMITLVWRATRSGLAFPLLEVSPKILDNTVPTSMKCKDKGFPSCPDLQDARPKYAFATLLTGSGDSNPDNYFTAVQLLTYQLIHDPQTGMQNATFVVLVTKEVSQDKRERLDRDGAIVIPVDNLYREWIHPKWDRWHDVLAKLQLWKLTDYEKVTFLDADTIVLRPLDDIFLDPATTVRETLGPVGGASRPTSPVLDRYMIAGIHDCWVEAYLPPKPGVEFYELNNYMNAGFFVLAPSERMFDYYLSLLDTPNGFDSAYPEQNLLNYAHRKNGRMPW